eukprot:CAMPEP_0114226394 /NCGR_PEP_ID=MMETSP0058-20121206/1212_1 /TAXON_ID=36894 /ORGANISM="Pyramimonas parkeae, CCMP726" /LENGTH=225 /DNA_ID=CAMNT_0001337123 /DNA_START=252 /DNA_END=929 /DNA_ORIENTATION=-
MDRLLRPVTKKEEDFADASSQLSDESETETSGELESAQDGADGVFEISYKERAEKAEELKREGNVLYAEEKYLESREKYTAAVQAAPPEWEAIAVYYANRAASNMFLGNYEDVVDDCTKSLELRPEYAKARQRRAHAYEKLDDVEKALEDLKAIMANDSGHFKVVGDVNRLEALVEERRERLKDEMIGKLKDLGNNLLGNFGMSLDNFKATQDPATGSYNISFHQ